MYAAGEALGNYTVVQKLGEGGMGAVYEAEHRLIGRRAAIKVLHPQLLLHPGLMGRFLNERGGPGQRRQLAAAARPGTRQERYGRARPPHSSTGAL